MLHSVSVCYRSLNSVSLGSHSVLHSVSLCCHSVSPCTQFSFTLSFPGLLLTFLCHSNSSYHYSSINHSTWPLWWYNLVFRTVTWRNWICWLSSAVWPHFRSWLLSWYDLTGRSDPDISSPWIGICRPDVAMTSVPVVCWTANRLINRTCTFLILGFLNAKFLISICRVDRRLFGWALGHH